MKISIITITFNSEKTLEDTICSVINQDYPELEYLIIDGGSTDNTLQIVNKYRDRIATVVSEPDHGISDAFNKGIRLATGELIGIINSDDQLMSGALQKLSNALLPDTSVIYGNAIMFGNGQKEYRFRSEADPALLRKEMSLVHPATFVRKAAYEKYGLFDLKYKCVMDRDLLLRMYTGGAKFQYLDEDLAHFRLGGVNQRTYLHTTIPESEEISRKYGMSAIQAKRIAFKSAMRFRSAAFVRRFPFSNAIRKLFHSKYSDLDV